MSRFTIPADFKVSTLEALAQKNNQWAFPVKEVYGCMNPSVFSSGRKGSDLTTIGFKELERYVNACRDHDIEFNYSLNLGCNSNDEFTPKGLAKLIVFTKRLGDLGIQRFTVALPSIIELLNEHVPDARVGVSVITTIDSPFRVETFLSSKNVDRVVLPAFINRNKALLQQVTACRAEHGVEFGTIVNSLCFLDCPFRPFHYSSVAHQGRESRDDYYLIRCWLLKFKNPVQFLKAPWIRPENLREYEKMGVEWFKISGRELKNKADFIQAVDTYNRESFDGDLMDLLMNFSGSIGHVSMPNKDLDGFARGFLGDKTFCSGKNCGTCNYCERNAHLVHVNEAAIDGQIKTLEEKHARMLTPGREQSTFLRRAVSKASRSARNLLSVRS